MNKHYWSQNWFAHHVIKGNLSRLREEVSDARFESAEDLRYVLSIINQLESDIGRVLLKVHSIADLLVEQGILSEDDLARKATELDSMDGNNDGILHPVVFRTEEEHQETPSARGFLIEMEKHAVSPDEFLGELESRNIGEDEEE